MILINPVTISLIVIILVFAIVRLCMLNQRPFKQANLDTNSTIPDRSAYLQAVNMINFMIIRLNNGEKTHFTATDAAELEPALTTLLGTSVEARPMTSTNINVYVTLPQQDVQTIKLTLDLPKKERFDRNKKTTIRVDQTVVTSGRQFFAAIRHALHLSD
ncbi:hypothetical protein [Lactiplantibacillus mudanjiangensis]|uniref:Uncharacterized protein n=1 Tax=Lactiplantibacillus mudanjiangensis TaxID=1296538 RepID=A0A660E008_9LACO|nr:hypothetical protein [Lactiplantibacillus mudanjiangensis]VDG18183.1 hypothetical protein MUDAN_BIHEEGNE_03105 [Lactiplantibacillus mudanjiangensis]VDG25861.1 hypothetical protein MUDAN_IGPPGNFN_01306 [Lactiplantibacillus mudanjiangensis]VDG28710.1 hypothetical protein MUDAN_MDHGFNIF_03120 [Lactiplantibacillus mudanjiangensis]VDG33694.1 hypothetical protein MUDAN_DOGOELCO_02836 [Lactiplantibacillus mudanjiangensis]